MASVSLLPDAISGTVLHDPKVVVVAGDLQQRRVVDRVDGEEIDVVGRLCGRGRKNERGDCGGGEVVDHVVLPRDDPGEPSAMAAKFAFSELLEF